jgi:hypothetical protein
VLVELAVVGAVAAVADAVAVATLNLNDPHSLS